MQTLFDSKSIAYSVLAKLLPVSVPAKGHILNCNLPSIAAVETKPN